MSNRFRREREEEEQEQEIEIKPVRKKATMPRNFFTVLLADGVISKEAASEMMPFIIFIAFLGMVYIGNRHFTERNIRNIDKLNKEVQEMRWDYKTLKADLMLKSTQTEVAKKVDTLGLREPVEPPKKLMVPVLKER